MAVSKRTRYEVLRRDGHACRYCGGRAPDVVLTVDHVVPTALGGTDNPDNLVAACRDCNAGKSASCPDAALVAQVSEDAVRWARAMKLAVDTAAASRALAAEEVKPWFDEWFLWSGPGSSYHLPTDAGEKVGGFLTAGLPMKSLRDAARIACRARGVDNRFGYFVGVANNFLRELQETALRLIAEGAV